MPETIYMYGDQETGSCLNMDTPKVILFGGYLGYNNFGDILQLKEAIAFHKNKTVLEPVIVCHVSSIPDNGFLSRLRNWFGVRAIIFVQDHAVDMALLDLHLIDSFFPVKSLHLYGGGFLNKYWGDYFIKLVEGLIEIFEVDNYVISGQQVGAEFAATLKAHFDKFRPGLIGSRDVESQTIITSLGHHCDFSFDDAADIIRAWACRKPAYVNGRAALLVHLNTSKYTWLSSDEKKKELDRATQTINMLSKKFRNLEPVFLNAYSEYRVTVKDTLATIINMEDSFPFLDYRVMDIAHMALRHDPGSSTIDENLAIFGAGVAVSYSYHTALFCNMLGIPCYLLSDNKYYRQKKEGLGEDRTLEQFMENPELISYSDSMEKRTLWLEKLTCFFMDIDKSPVKDRITVDYNKSRCVPSAFHFKSRSVAENRNIELQEVFTKIITAIKRIFSRG